MRDYHFYYFQWTTLIHAAVGCVVDPLVLYYCGYRYNQPNHLYYNLLMVHSFAYFTYDSIIERYYQTDDLITIAHHIAVLVTSVVHLRAPYSGFEYIVAHFFAEISNPFLAFRTILKIRGLKKTTLYLVNDVIFAVLFLTARLIITPVLVVSYMEASNVYYCTKFGLSFALFIQQYWCYRVLYLITETIIEAYNKKQDKKAPWVILGLHSVF